MSESKGNELGGQCGMDGALERALEEAPLNVSAIRDLMSRGANPDVCEKFLNAAVDKDQINPVLALLLLGADPKGNLRKRIKCQALINSELLKAAKFCNVSRVKDLLIVGANVDVLQSHLKLAKEVLGECIEVGSPLPDSEQKSLKHYEKKLLELESVVDNSPGFP